MGIVRRRLTDENRKAPSQWKDRFIYTMLGLFAGMFGIHNFYLRRFAVGAAQALTALLWIVLLRFPWSSPAAAKFTLFAAFAIFLIEVVWVTLELFLVKREPDGDAMNDEARPVRLLLIAVFWIAFILLPAAFALLMSGPEAFLDPVRDRLEGNFSLPEE